MAEPQIQQPGPAGKYWRHLAVGTPVGVPLAEWAYVTPRFPDGISQSALQDASPEVQRETAIVWFSLNLEPYALGGGPYFGFARANAEGQSSQTANALVGGPLLNAVPVNAAPYGSQPYAAAPYAGAQPRIAGFNQAVWAPARLDAAAVLSGEFGAILPESVIVEVAHDLPGQWMWRQRPPLRPVDPAELTADRAELGANILARLDALEEALRDLRPAPGEIGHNRPPEGFGLPPEDDREVQAVISRARTALASEGETSGAELQAAADDFKPVAVKFGEWALGQLNTFITEANKSVAQGAGKALVAWILAHEIVHGLPSLLEQAARLIGRH